jgi:hypothetical protein
MSERLQGLSAQDADTNSIEPTGFRLSTTGTKQGLRTGIALDDQRIFLTPALYELLVRLISEDDSSWQESYSPSQLRATVSRLRDELQDDIITAKNGLYSLTIDRREIDIESFCANQTIVTEVFLSLGKALKENRLTIEGHWRVLKLIDTFFEESHQDTNRLFIFCGHRGDSDVSEAQMARDAFKFELQKRGLRWDCHHCLIEDQSRFSFENLRRGLRRFQEEANTSTVLVTKLHICSSDYHVARLFDEDRWLPELSTLRELRQELKCEIVAAGAPCVFVEGYAQQSWLARGYLSLHRLSLLQSNLMGIAGTMDIHKSKRGDREVEPGTVRELRPVSFQRLVESIEELEKLEHEVEAPYSGGFQKRVEEAMEVLPKALDLLRELRAELEGHVGKHIHQPEKGLWRKCRDNLNDVFYPLRTKLLDPDGVSSF